MSTQVPRRSFGHIIKLKSGWFQARYHDPNGRVTNKGVRVRYPAPHTFTTRGDAEAWLVDARRMISEGMWTPPPVRRAAKQTARLTFGEYAPTWLAAREVKGQPLADRTRDHYQDLLDRVILPTFADLILMDVSPDLVAEWYDAAAADRPTYEAHAYSLLRAIMLSRRSDQEQREPFGPVQPVRHLRGRLIRRQAQDQARHGRGGR